MEFLLRDIEKYVTNLLNKELPAFFFYHNISHVKQVLLSAKELCEGESINEGETLLLLIAVWFHDIGYTLDSKNHEDSSAAIAKSFLEKKGISNDQIDVVVKLIKATKLGHKPNNILEKIICDADCAHLASKEYNDISELLRYEWEQVLGKKYTDKEWIKENISFLTNHHCFYTDYALNKWQPRKNKNLIKLVKSLKKEELESEKIKFKKEEIKLKKKKLIMPERGVETLFRVTLRNHIALSGIADTKANILLSVNAIIVSLVLSNLIPKLDNPSNTYLIYPTVIFVLFTIAVLILSVLATRPNVTSGKFTKQDVKDKKVNLLFFGNFHKMEQSEFEWAMNELMNDKEYLYSSMSKDLYFLGKVLDVKYTILRLTYTIFIIGLVISLIAFSIAFQFA